MARALRTLFSERET